MVNLVKSYGNGAYTDGQKRERKSGVYTRERREGILKLPRARLRERKAGLMEGEMERKTREREEEMEE